MEKACKICSKVPHYARLLCRQCYSRAYYSGTLKDRPLSRVLHPGKTRENANLYQHWRNTKGDRVERWDDFNVFLKDMVASPYMHARLAKKDANKPFSPTNFLWVRKGTFITTEKAIIPIVCNETGEVFNSMMEAAEHYRIHPGNVSHQIGGRRKTAGNGLTFRVAK